MSEWKKNTMFELLDEAEKNALIKVSDEYTDFLKERYACVFNDSSINKREKYDRMFSIVRKLNDLDKTKKLLQ